MKFVDLSANNSGPIDFKGMRRAGARIVGLKVSEGATFDDSKYKGWKPAANEAGLLVWAYHFARPDNNTPREEVDHFLTRSQGRVSGKQELVLDYEPPSGGGDKWVGEFCDRARKDGEPVRIMYGGRHLREQRIKAHGTVLWLAAYTPSWQPWLPAGWAKQQLAAWQYTETGGFAGVPGRCDVNLWTGNDEMLNRMLGGQDDPLKYLTDGERRLVVKLGEVRTDVARAGGWDKNPKRKALAEDIKAQLGDIIDKLQRLDPNDENRRERLNLLRDARAGRKLDL